MMASCDMSAIFALKTSAYDDDLKVTIRRALESLDLVRERDALRERVKSRDTLLKNLEKEHPGITQVEKDDDGYLILE